ncbi:hypothetical protein [Halobellus sp. EA9]|uniref:hypothetical protein n=1 Tax=Halobellus sp. EA9 TaxID=3421647 RepID=UPI003EBFE7F2
MELPRSIAKVSAVLRSRLLVPAVVAFAAGIAGVAFGLSHDDIVTVLGALLFVPSGLLLIGIVARRHNVGPFASSRRRAN